ncbi:MAG: T9SS type A sorting domain-containing protein [Bacteroidetes bacterium]|nr:T9SS type A sorting domain-containing protein [Bacteroidota bacterium]
MEKSLILDVLKYAKIVLLLFLLLLSFTLFSQDLPAERSIDWSKAGLETSQVEVEYTINIMDFGATANGVSDDYASICLAIDYFAGMPGIIFFPPGYYLFGSPINLPSNIILRGASSDSSFFYFDFSECSPQSCINVCGKESRAGEKPVTAAAAIETYSLEIQEASNLFPGDYIEIYQENGSWDIKPADWATGAVGQVIQIKDIDGNRLTLNEKLHFTYDTALHPKIRKINPVKNVGIEYLHIKRYACVDEGSGYNIFFNMAVNCWVKGVESSMSYQSHVMINSSSHIEISGSYFHHAFSYEGSATHGYGITLNRHSTQCLIEDNIFKHLRHAMMAKNGANGNVIAYNYSTDPFRSEVPANAAADISLHGHFAHANLIEGNIVQNIVIDHYWGPSGPLNTFLRNRAELYGIIMTTSSCETNNQNFIGNETSNTMPLLGNFFLTGNNHFSCGNNIKGTIIPANSNQFRDESMYLNELPDFWTIKDNWPSIGIPNVLNSGSIPAKERFLKGEHFTVFPWAADSNTLSRNMNQLEANAIQLFPNPFTDKISLDAGEFDRYSIINMQGAKVMDGIIGEGIMNLSTHGLNSGTYVLLLSSVNSTAQFKIQKKD